MRPFSGIMLSMTSTSVSSHHKITRPNLVAVGTIVWLSSELMFFAALFAMYFTTRAVQGPEIWAQTTEVLNIPFAAFNTTVLVLSSVTCQFGVFAAERYQARRTGSLIRVSTWGMREWFSLTFLMGAFFIASLINCIQFSLLHNYRFPRPTRNWWTHRIPYRSRPRCKGSSLYSRSSNNRNCRLLLLALCRCSLDCTFRIYLSH